MGAGMSALPMLALLLLVLAALSLVRATPSLRPASPRPSSPTLSPSLKPSLEQGVVPLVSRKRGVADNYAAGNASLLNGVWFYTWGAKEWVLKENKGKKGPEFVPMIARRETVYPPEQAAPAVVLGFNEPDVVSGASLTPAQALELWPAVERIGAGRIGSPACTRRYIFEWLPLFLAGTSAYKPRVDFVAVHWYSGSAFEFLQFLDKVWRTFGLPIWVTEFSIADWGASAEKPSLFTEDDVIAFILATVPRMEALAYVERYAWYSDPALPAVAFASLWRDTSTPSDAGLFYAGVLQDPRLSRTPSSARAETSSADQLPPTAIAAIAASLGGVAAIGLAALYCFRRSNYLRTETVAV